MEGLSDVVLRILDGDFDDGVGFCEDSLTLVGEVNELHGLAEVSVLLAQVVDGLEGGVAVNVAPPELDHVLVVRGAEELLECRDRSEEEGALRVRRP